MYYIGIDGGGTFSRLIAVDESGNVVGRHTGNSTNICSNTIEVVRNNITKLVSEFNQQTNTKLSDCKSFCIGSAGIDTKDSVVVMTGILRDIGIAYNIKVVNDSEIILAAQTKGKSGICVISGTGSVAFAIDDDGNEHRAGGWGYIIDDGGSGYYVGMQAIKNSLLAYDGRGIKTSLVSAIKEHFKIDDLSDVLNFVYTDKFNKSKIAELALIVKNEALKGDIVSLSIEEEAAFELFRLVKALIERTKLLNHKIVLSGSVILLNDNIRNKFTQLVLKDYKNMEISPIKETPEMGAVYLAINNVI